MNAAGRKIGRNERCSCGSGRKYKHCCGNYSAQPRSWNELPSEVRLGLNRAIAERQAEEVRRRQQQGLGRPIISFESDGHRLVAVGDTIHWSKKWKTFHDFLFDYIKDVFGREWGAKEQAKSLDKQHILLRWGHEIGDYHKIQRTRSPGTEIISSPATPTLTAYLGLAYNLYLLKLNAELQRVLVTRLKSRDESSFHGAYYETFVAAAFIKAGYDIAFENEKDGSATHCEFIATSNTSPRKFSVEAKARFRQTIAADVDPATLKLGIKDKLESALQKQADHTRVVFIDVNLPEKLLEGGRPFWVDAALDEVRDLESTMIISEQETPTAYVVITNHPYQFATSPGLSAVMEGFNISEFKLGAQFQNLRAALEARSRHADIHGVFEAMKNHHEIPSTFAGEMPETHFSRTGGLPSLKVGGHYLVPDENEVEHRAELESACVLELEKMVYGIYRLEDGRRIVATSPLTDAELEAYRKYPKTFFGTIDENAGRTCNDILDWYDFFFQSYQNTPREKLLDFMKDAIDIEQLKSISQEELAKIYCERLAYSIEHKGRNA